MGKISDMLNKVDHTSRPTDEKRQCPNCFKRNTWNGKCCSSCGARG